ALESLARATHFIFDKTGTLTKGRLHLLATHIFTKYSKIKCLQYAIALEQQSEHPIAQAFKSNSKYIQLKAEEVVNYPGAGIQGKIDGEQYFIGTAIFIKKMTGLNPDPQLLRNLQQDGNSLILLAKKSKSSQFMAAFVLGDEIRAGSKKLIQSLKKQGKSVGLLSGDHITVVQRVATEIGIDIIGAAMTPEGKLQQVKALQTQGAIVAMIGDGVNDSPVLAQAQISIAMGSGTQVARTSADMILLTEQLPNLLIGINTAHNTLKIIRQNIIWAIGYNLLALPAAAMGWVAPWMAAIGMSLSSLLVVTNALRLTVHPPLDVEKL
ncbi:HAD-IC family P-type ATPase, partial [Thiotrichales bacterium HSG1]|nr:HAD-IC family P-type ATPase [Thiotrichales bacterium HSG1]